MKPLRYALAFVLLATTAFAQDPARMEQVIQSYVHNRTFMGAVLVARGTDVLLNKGYGSANLEWDIPNSPSTKFRLGSITKQFTAAAILLLEERGKLSTSDPIKKHLPDAPAAWDAITIHHLLTHTAGIRNFTSLPEYAGLRGTSTTVEKTIGVFRDMPLDFPVGEKMQYSNSGYLVLGDVIEKLSGGSYDKFVQDNLFTPLGLKEIALPAVAAKYAAVYEMAPGITMTIFVEGPRMFGQLTGQPRFEMFAESDTAFFVRTVDAQLTFGVEAGTVTHIVLHQAGRDMKGVRK